MRGFWVVAAVLMVGAGMALGEAPPRPVRGAATRAATTRKSVLTDAEREQFRAEMTRPGITLEERKAISAKWLAIQAARLGQVPRPGGGPPMVTTAENARYGEVRAGDIENARRMWEADARNGEAALRVKFRTVETAHYVIYTDWSASQDAFLKERFESAYDSALKFFERPETDTVYVGKLPAFVLRSQEEFMRFAKEVDHMEPKDLRGYYQRSEIIPGLGHIVTYDALTGGPVGKMVWSSLVTHELTHSFVHRYRTNVRPPMWVNEAIAMVVAGRQYPTVDRDWQDRARRRAVEIDRLEEMFQHKKGFLDLKYYPIARSVAEMLIKRDGKAFLAYLGDIKDGVEPEAALEKHYQMNYAQLEKAWRTMIERS